MRESRAIKFAIHPLLNGYVVEIDPEGHLLLERYIHVRDLEAALLLLHGNIERALLTERARMAQV